jgi:carbamoyltransferase
MSIKILGISAFYHDSAIAVIVDGKIVAAAQEERFSRKRHDSEFPALAIKWALDYLKLKISDFDYIVFYDKPFLKFERILETYINFAPVGFKSFKLAMPLWIKDKLFLKSHLIKMLSRFGNEVDGNKILFSGHHLSHAAGAFYPSPFNSAAILTLDGVGEWATGSFAIGNNNSLEIKSEMHFPDSLGLLYSAFTYFTGFKVNSGEYKLMGLAPYGRPIYAKLIMDNLVDLKSDGSFSLNLKYFDFCTGLRMTSAHFEKLFKIKRRIPESKLEQQHMDLAASIQFVTEEIMLKLADHASRVSGLKNLCLSGGVALNCVANGKLHKSGLFENIWIQPASGDAGSAIGAALAVYYLALNSPRNIEANSIDGMSGSYLGPGYSDDEIERSLASLGAKFRKFNEDDLIEHCAKSLVNGKAIGWFQGKMEFGPRSLGARSILGDARSPEMQKILNLKVKYRESFRPFAPAILAENISEWFDFSGDSPYMLMVAPVKKSKTFPMSEHQQALFGIDRLNVVRSEIPAVTHVDYSARLQTVHKSTNPLFSKLINKFNVLTGVPILVNTSFNVRGEPIVCSPEDAFRCFMGTELDGLAIGSFYCEKNEQVVNREMYEHDYELD